MQKGVSKLYRTLVCGGEVSLAVLDTAALAAEAARLHALSPVAAAALGRALTAGAYLCGWLKREESALTVSLDGGGAGGRLCVSGDGALRMRGFAEHPQVFLPLRADGEQDVAGFVGKAGVFTVSRDDGEGLPFSGATPLVSGDVEGDLSAYFLESEQRPTAVALGVRADEGGVHEAYGVFMQPLPGAGAEAHAFARERIARYRGGAAPFCAEEILRALGAEKWEEREIVYRCSCSRARARQIVAALGREEAEKVAAEEGKISVHCHWCNTDHTFTPREVSAIFGGGEKG